MTRDRRSKLDLYADILEAIKEKSRKTHIVYKANLNFKRCEDYLQELKDNGLIKVKAHSPLQWDVTEKGKEFLEKYDQLRDLLPR
ncbi:hypothetical protein AKJ41_06040 [candidate division MSBL1 archaeon SCGC-AAA259O05]|uniref:ArnR1-like winged helix-turn-helix domain-containing protein n=1 Tax=candidate division MSBL1 archaeon SCGC-AAA259O05 TaxID=1698271 RepID=A0A133UXX6_9EURY|nr:hypothetical protein AKJ41_06040 [candidate division MSBL1 archaeon SCGC-AAA259O05]